MKNKKKKAVGIIKKPHCRVKVRESDMMPFKMVPYNQAFNRAILLLNTGRIEAARKLLMQLLEQVPVDVRPVKPVLRTYYDTGDLDGAQLFLYQMESLYKTRGAVMAEVAKFYQRLGESQRAKALMEETLEDLCDGKASIYAGLGGYYKAKGDRSQAIEMFRLAVEECPEDAVYIARLAELCNEEIASGLEERIHRLLSSSQIKRGPKSQLYFALASLTKKQGGDTYFSYLQQANALADTGNRELLDDLESYCDKASRVYSDSFISHHQAAECKDKPPIFIISPPRSGSTLVEQILGAHKDCAAVGESFAMAGALSRIAAKRQLPKDISDWTDGVHQQVIGCLAGEYFNRKPISLYKGLNIVDKSIENVWYVGLILLTWPNAKVIRINRHALDTIFSCFQQSFESGSDYFFNLEALANYYLLYNRLMDVWESAFPGRIYRLCYEELIKDQHTKTRELVEYCELGWSEDCLNFYSQDSTVQTASAMQVRQPIYSSSIGAWKDYRERMLPAIKILENHLGEKIE